MPLNDLQCKAAKPKDKPFKLFDGEGLYLEIAKSGNKFWRLKYRIGQKEKLLTIGDYPRISLLVARQEREKIRNEVKSGQDPVILRQERLDLATYNSEQTFESVAREWHEINKSGWDPRYARTVMHRFEKYVFPDFGLYPLHQLKPLIILRCLQRIEKSAPEMARRVKQTVSHICKYAIVTGRLESDPTYGLEVALKKYKKGHFASVSIEELPELLKTIYDHKARLYRQTYLSIKLLLLTFVRTSELIDARWVEIDLERKIWIIPPERMKMRSEHVVPLSCQACEIFTELRKLNPYHNIVFPGIPRPSKPMSKGTILVALKRMGYSRRMTGHGFRSLALGVIKEQLGYSHEVADRQLAHAPKSSTDRAYDRAKFIEQRKKMMQDYADYLDRVLLHQINVHNY
jgi:integrase